jgi:hypothetical protein
METRIGRVTHYFNRLGVAVLELTDSLKVGDAIRFRGHTTEFDQVVASMEINHNKVVAVGPGADVALKVVEPVREGDIIYRLSGDEAQEVLSSSAG